MSKFKPGNKILCVNNEGTRLELHKVYTVAKDSLANDFVRVEESTGEHSKYEFLKLRFILATPELIQKYSFPARLESVLEEKTDV